MRYVRKIARPARVLLISAGLLNLMASAAVADEPIDFQRDILPVLSEHCFACHGPDEGHREAGLRLDDRAAASSELASGLRAIVANHPEASELVRRIESSDPGEQMPPPDGKPLSDEQKQRLRRWILAGADYSAHWSFIPPVRPALPEVADPAWCRTPVDRFIAATHARQQLAAAPEADRRGLIRRLHLDLTGLPPTPAEIAEFVGDRAPDAYGRLVDRLLSSPHYGERMAMFWLDAARYSDTDGFQGDATRTNWPWRDWVIDAFNHNMPFDQFTVEQFAGDLLPDALPSQRLATCFHRNHMTNGEGGRDPEESRIDYVIDRVNTTGTVWLGLTLGCCQCHSHKYDPISQADYYRLTAFFNSIDEDGRAGSGANPFMSWQSSAAAANVAEAQQWLAHQESLLAAARQRAADRFPAWLGEQFRATRSGYAAWQPWQAEHLESEAGTQLEQLPEAVIQARGPDPHHEDYRLMGSVALPRITGLKLEVLPDASHTAAGLSRSESGHFVLSDIKLRWRSAHATQWRDVKIAEAHADYQADPAQHDGYGNVRDALDDDPRNGWASFGAPLTERRTAVFRLQTPLELSPADVLLVELQQRALQGRHNLGRFRLLLTTEVGETPRSLKPAPLEELAAQAIAAPDQVDAGLRERLFAQYLAGDVEYTEVLKHRDRAAAQLTEAQSAAGSVQVMVLGERAEPRETHLLVRGVWDQKGETVIRDVPAAIAGWPEELPRDRRGLALWLTDRRNPLTARVTVNHLWGLMFGAGLVRTPEDFGLQGERPTHPELLDWLAVELIESGWDMKHLLRLIVTSATYRQQSQRSAEQQAADPDNRWLARGARFRLPSWMIRDGMLHSAGLLNGARGGPPQRPYQPPGIWEDITMGRYHYEPTEGPARYRRTVYAFWRRSAAPAFLFDSAQRRVCEVRTSRTNTPLQALTLLNDLTGLEAARALATGVIASHRDPAARIGELMLRVVARPASDEEAVTLAKHYAEALAYYEQHPDDTQQFLGLGQVPAGTPLDSPELAATMVVASMILNTDEAITRE